MTILTTENCRDVAQSKLDAVNKLKDHELRDVIAKDEDLGYGKHFKKTIKYAYDLRVQAGENIKRNDELDISKESNEIARAALEQAKLANKKSDHARIISWIAILASVTLSVLGWVLFR